MQSIKFSVSLPKEQYDFIQNYQLEQQYGSRSDVLKEAIKLLQDKKLETYYAEANSEIDNAFDAADLDGLDKNETW